MADVDRLEAPILKKCYQSILILAGAFVVSICAAQDDVELEPCESAILDPIAAMLNTIIDDEDDELGVRSYVESEPIYVMRKVHTAGCQLGTRTGLFESSRYIYVVSQNEREEIVNATGAIKMFTFSSVVYLDEGRVEIDVGAGVLRKTGDRIVWYGCSGPAWLFKKSGKWKLESWTRKICS